MSISYINQILSWKIPLFVQLTNFWVVCKKKYLLWKYWSFQWLKNKEWFSDYDISPSLFDWTKKNQWISGIARLRNAQDFLEICIESHLPYFDEIILADNMSQDSTRTICQNLQKKYPKKIKAIQYPFITHKLWSQEYKSSTSDSVYDLSYFYNRVLSHVSYKWVAKVDDDHLMISEIMEQNRKLILSNTKYDNYYQMLGINIIKRNGIYYIPTQWPFMGLYWDHGFFPISHNTYYIHDDWSENFLHDYCNSYLPISFIHLKYLREHTRNYIWSYNVFNNKIMQWWSLDLPNKYYKILNQRVLW